MNNKVRFEMKKMSFKSDIKIRYKLYTLMLKKYFNNIGNIIKVLSGAMAVFVIGVFSILSFGNIDTPYSDNLDKHINTSTISLSKEYRSKRLLAYKRAALKSTTNFLKAKKYKELSFKRKVVNTKK